MSYDFYVYFKIENEEDVDNLTSALGRFAEIGDVFSRIQVLINSFKYDNLKNYARVGNRYMPRGLKALIHSNGNYNDYLSSQLYLINQLGINLPVDISDLPEGSWVIEIPLTLKKPFISKDDIPLYIIENPVRKDKVFAIPITSAMSWKGNLRWTMMKIHLEPKKNNPLEFAETRFRHTLLFGTEKGIEENPKGWTKYLDELCKEAKEEYRNKLKEYFNCTDIPHIEGMLYFYSTFWDRIDMEVINPHERKTKTGKHPIYFEVVPEGAKGMFRILYVPIHYIGRYEKTEFIRRVKSDLSDVVDGLREMMLTFGFSAKKTIGYGVIKEPWDERQSRLAVKTQEKVSEFKFKNFEELRSLANRLWEA